MNKLKIFSGIFVAIVAIYFSANFFIYNERIKKICDSSLSMDYLEVELRSKKLSLIFSGRNDEFIVHSTKNFGRGICLLKVDAKGVVEGARFDMD